MSKMLESIKIGNKIAPNRIVMNAMECCDADENGNPTAATYARYEKLFEGKAGVVDLEAITAQYESRSRKFQLSIMPKNAKELEKFVAHLKKINKDTVFVFQLTHSGEISHPDFSKRVRVTKEPLYGYENSTLIGETEINKIMDEFVLAAKIAHDAGADGVDLKFCHGYLGSQILRPFNKENWKYGGNWENRKQYAIDLTSRVVKEINDPNFIVGSKVSIYEGFPGGQGTASADSGLMDLTESIDLIKSIEQAGAKYILQSAGSPSHTLALSQPDKKIPDYGYLHHYFQKVCRDNLKKETVVMGSAYSIFRNGKTSFQAVKPENNTFEYWANKNIEEGITDMVALGRQSFADPYLPLKFMENRQEEIKWCTACDNCIEFLIRQEHVGCATFNKEFTKRMSEIRKEKGLLKEKHT